TYGFPIDLTRLIAQELALTVDEKGFEAEMSAQKNRSKAATASDVGDWMIVSKNDASPVFIGYSNLSTSTELLRYRKVNTKGQSFYQLVLAETPFYAESGGQVGDTGTISMNGSVLEVTNTKKENDLIVHTVTALPDQVTASVVASVDSSRRKEITAHHTLTHLIHAALRAVLGSHVAQKGSLVDNEGMRFDFSHFAKMTEEELSAVEKMVNQKIRENIPVVIRTMPKDEALQLGAMALFGEKYGETVRVVTIDPNYSVELCGGTHVMSTGELGYCMLTSESGVAAGVRRIEAICSVAAEREMMQQRALLEQLKEMFKQPKDILKTIEGQAEELHAVKKQLEAAEAKMLLQLRKELAAGFKQYTGCSFLGISVEVGSPDALKKLCNDLRNEADDRMIVLTAVIGGKPFVAVGLSDALQKVKGLDAGQIIKTTIAPLIKGGGGGQKTLATAGGQETGGLPSVLTSVQSLLG
ncbi:MAG: hypothetical protein RIQ50_1201, partial [Bacteroidota bacterium]